MIELISEIINANILLSVTIYLYELRRKSSMKSQIVRFLGFVSIK